MQHAILVETKAADAQAVSALSDAIDRILSAPHVGDETKRAAIELLGKAAVSPHGGSLNVSNSTFSSHTHNLTPPADAEDE